MRTSHVVVVSVMILCWSFNESLAQWVRSDGPYSGFVNSLAVSGTSVYAGMGDGEIGGYGVFRSTDDGAHWTGMNAGLKNTFVFCLAVSPASPLCSSGNVFAGTWGGGVFRSTDGAKSWNGANTGLLDSIVLGLYCIPVCGPNGSNTILASTYHSGSFRSTDDGSTWTSVKAGDSTLFAIAFANWGTLLFAAGEGVHRSTDDGVTWTTVNNGLTDTYVLSLAVLPDSNGTGTARLFAGTYSGGVFSSTDYGDTWTPTGLVDAFVPSLAVIDAKVFAGTDFGVLISSDRGSTWSVHPLLNEGIQTLAVVPVAEGSGVTHLLAGTYGHGVFGTTNYGTTWDDRSSGLVMPAVTSLVACPSLGVGKGESLFAGASTGEGGGGVFHSVDNGMTWQLASNGLNSMDVTTLAVAPTSGTGSNATLFAGTFGAGVFVSSDNGINWTEANNGLADESIGCLAVLPAPDSTGNSTLLISTHNHGIYRSSNAGALWTQVNNGLGDAVTTCFLSFGTALIAGGNHGVFRSPDNGVTWNLADTGLTNTSVQALAASGQSLFAATKGGVFVSTDTCRSWKSTALNNSVVWNLIAVPSPAGNGGMVLIANTGVGIRLSTNAGSAWTNSDTLSAGTYVRSILVMGDNLFVGTDDTGIWSRPLSELVTCAETSGPPVRPVFSLQQNYPNPFNPTTIIRYALPRQSHVTLAVFNILGQQVANLVDAVEEPGEHTVPFDGTGLASGVYFYRLRAGDYVATKRLILVR